MLDTLVLCLGSGVVGLAIGWMVARRHFVRQLPVAKAAGREEAYADRRAVRVHDTRRVSEQRDGTIPVRRISTAVFGSGNMHRSGLTEVDDDLQPL